MKYILTKKYTADLYRDERDALFSDQLHKAVVLGKPIYPKPPRIFANVSNTREFSKTNIDKSINNYNEPLRQVLNEIKAEKYNVIKDQGVYKGYPHLCVAELIAQNGPVQLPRRYCSVYRHQQMNI